MCECVALLPSTNLTGVRPRCSATQSSIFFTVLALHTSHSTLRLHSTSQCHYNVFGKHHAAKSASFYAHGNSTWQYARSHSTAICNHTLHKRIKLRTHDQTLIAERTRRKGTKNHPNDRHAPAAHVNHCSSSTAASQNATRAM